MDTSFLYDSLDESRREIRLITLLPSEDDEGEIACLLETASLDDEPEYAALSYVWGDPDDTIEILVNDIVFSATINLASGLIHFRRYGLGLPGKEDVASLPRLWVDAICINQQDTAERNQQVALMGDTYTKASYVLTWLGLPRTREIDPSIRLIRDFSQALPSRLKQEVLHTLENRGEEYHAAERRINDNSSGHLEMEAGDGADSETELIQKGLEWISEHPELHQQGQDHGAWDSIMALTDRTYWQRMWVQQEMVLSRGFGTTTIVRGGAEAVPFEDVVFFLALISALESRGIVPSELKPTKWRFMMLFCNPHILEVVVNMRALWKRAVPSPDLVPLIAQQCQATDPRDMVYGLRSLLHLKLDVDYHKTVRQVYLDWHAEALEQCQARGELETCGINWAGRGLSKDNHDLPSWLPNLAIMHKAGYVHYERSSAQLGPGGWFQLPGAEGQQFSDDGVLSVYGVTFDQVRGGSHAMIDRPEWHRTTAVRKLVVDYMLRMKTRDHPTGLLPLQVLLYTLHQGIDPDTKIPFSARLDPTSTPAWAFRYAALNGHEPDPSHDWSHVDLEAAGGLSAYLESRFRDTADEYENEQWGPLEELGQGMSKDDRQKKLTSFLASPERFLRNRAIFFTTQGYIGIGPKYTRFGDKLCVINNCPLPVLLREEGPGHVLVGAAYVYGLCTDEWRDMAQSGQVNLERFEIH